MKVFVTALGSILVLVSILACQQASGSTPTASAVGSILVEPLLSGYQLTPTFSTSKAVGRAASTALTWSSSDTTVLVIASLADLDGKVSDLPTKAAILTQDGVLTPIGGTGATSVTVTVTNGSQSVSKSVDLGVISYASKTGKKWRVVDETTGGTKYTAYDATNAPDIGVDYTVTAYLPAGFVLDPTFQGANPGWYPELPVAVDPGHHLTWIDTDHATVTPGTAGAFPEYTTVGQQLNVGYMTRSDHPGYLGFIAIGNTIYATQGLQIQANQTNATTLVMEKPDGSMAMTLTAQ